jgi:hypothetical protein
MTKDCRARHVERGGVERHQLESGTGVVGLIECKEWVAVNKNGYKKNLKSYKEVSNAMNERLGGSVEVKYKSQSNYQGKSSRETKKRKGKGKCVRARSVSLSAYRSEVSSTRLRNQPSSPGYVHWRSCSLRDIPWPYDLCHRSEDKVLYPYVAVSPQAEACRPFRGCWRGCLAARESTSSGCQCLVGPLGPPGCCCSSCQGYSIAWKMRQGCRTLFVPSNGCQSQASTGVVRRAIGSEGSGGDRPLFVWPDLCKQSASVQRHSNESLLKLGRTQ